MLITTVQAGIGYDEILRAVLSDQRLRRVVTRAIIDDLADRVDSSSVDRAAARRLIAALGEIDGVVAAPRNTSLSVVARAIGRAHKASTGPEASPSFRSEAHALAWAKAHARSSVPSEAKLARRILRDLEPKAIANDHAPVRRVKAQSPKTEKP
jgi:hypothetical protein